MAIIKCKMCGGDLNVEENSQIAVCEYCGTQQTVPKQDNEKKLTLFARANRLRFACEFDKAAGVYESIVAEFPEEAEAYWGLVLCKYGIEYVDDPATGKKVPTCHRSSFDSVLEDANFELVMEYSDVVTRKLYREEAKVIEELRRGIIEVSSREEPYDIFICYKETDENGQRTLDSVLAQDLYDALTEKGYRVFFSRITLEDKLGQEYEPYIFAALNSARVMLAVGTDYEYFNAPWVKNEWSRYLQLIAAGQKKSLIPCYKNIDAYDMPNEFAKLQAQDLGKVGATQDLLRGIDKLLGKPSAPAAPVQSAPIQTAAAPNVDSLLRRGNLFLEDGDWENANSYFNRVLDIAPECGIAYLCRASVNWECKTLEMLQRKYENASDMAVSSNNDFAKAIRFADNSLKVTLEQWEQSRTANQKREKANAEHRYADAEAQYAAALKSWNAQCETIMQQREQALQLCRKNEETRLKESALQQRNRVIQEKDAIIAEQTAIKANAEKAIASLGALKFLERSRKKSVIAQADEAICMAESEKQVAEAAYEESLTAISAVLTEAEQQFDEKIKADYPIPEEPEMSNDAFLYREKDYRIIYTCLCDMGRGLPHKLVDIQEHLSTGIQELSCWSGSLSIQAFVNRLRVLENRGLIRKIIIKNCVYYTAD